MKMFCKALIVSILTAIVVGGFSCRKPIKDRQQLIEFVNDPKNGLQQTEQIGDIKATMTYKPAQLMQSDWKNGNAKKNATVTLKDELFFVFSLSAKDKELLKQLPFNQYSEMVQVLSFRMNEFVDIVPDERKPVEPLECTFQQTYGMGVANNLLIVFDKKKLVEGKDLRLRIKEFGLNTGNLTFEFKTKNIDEIENITIN